MSETSLAMMPWFPRDFLASTRAMRLAERGAYRELLDYQWEMGILPPDHDRLARLLGVTLDEFSDLWPAIECKFVEVPGGLQNQRLEQHREKSLAQRDKKRKAAAETNAKRDAKRAAQRGECATLSDAMSDTHSGTPPSPSPSIEVGKKDVHTRAREIVDDAEQHVMFERVRKAYPHFAGRTNWITAENACRVRVEEGCSWLDLLAGVRRYATYVKGGGASSTAHVLNPVTFFTAPDKPWAQQWELPTPINGASNGAGSKRGQPRPSAIDRVRTATAHMAADDPGPSPQGVVVDG